MTLRIVSVPALLCWIGLLAPVSAAEPARAAGPSFAPDVANEIAFPVREAKFVRVVVTATSGGQACIDELEIYGGGKTNLALASQGGKATASSCLQGHPIHQVPHLNDGRYGNSHSWIAAGTGSEWAQIELSAPTQIARLVFSRDRDGHYRDRMPLVLEVRVSLDGQKWETAAQVKAPAAVLQAHAGGGGGYVAPAELPDPPTWDGLVRYAFLCERATWSRLSPADHLSPLKVERSALPGGEPYWGRIARLAPLERVLVQAEELLARLAAKGLDLNADRTQLAELRRRAAALPAATAKDDSAEETLYLDARLAKRGLLLRDPDLASLQRILFVKRHPYLASHNYSDVLDSQFRPGGGICTLDIPRPDGRLEPGEARLATLFDGSGGIARDPMLDFDATKIYFAHRPDKGSDGGQERYWHLMSMNVDGTQLQRLTDGPFHDYYPCPLPDGGLAFISTRCRARFLCWRPQAFVLFRMNLDGSDMRPLSYANLSEWSPTVARDGRILWTRSEYLDKGADFGHTLWAIRPDGSHPELIFGNDTPNCYMNGREVPGLREICCTLFSHGGDHNGPIGLIDLGKGPFDPAAITNITPDVNPHYNMSWPRTECFRDPVPVSQDYFLASHAPADRWGLYVVDRYGNRELLYLDPELGSMCPSPLRPTRRPPLLQGDGQLAAKTAPGTDHPQRGSSPLSAEQEFGQFTVADVYQGLEPVVPRGKVKYLRVCQEVRADLDQLPTGEYRQDSGAAFQDFYAAPIHKVTGPFGWPSYVAKASLGLATVEADGSANFLAPAGKVLYFQALDENLNELQRMRSVVQLHAGERRSCVGCHDNRQTTPPVRQTLAMRRPPSVLEPPSWGTEPFSYEKVVQPVWDAKCVRCHDAKDERRFNLAGTLDEDRVPASYRTLIAGGWVHHFNFVYGLRHFKAEPLSFGTVKSKLWPILDAGHYDVKLTFDEMHRVKCWIDMNCPLWPDYMNRMDRPGPGGQLTEVR